MNDDQSLVSFIAVLLIVLVAWLIYQPYLKAILFTAPASNGTAGGLGVPNPGGILNPGSPLNPFGLLGPMTGGLLSNPTTTTNPYTGLALTGPAVVA